jgi:hypothetical protein
VRRPIGVRSSINLQGEPVVWFRDFRRPDDAGFQASQFDDSEFVQNLTAIGNIEHFWQAATGNERGVRTAFLGGVMYAPRSQTIADCMKKYGEGWEERFPRHDKMEHPTRGWHRIGCIEPDLVDDFRRRLQWWEILLLMGLRYCSRHAIVLGPDGYRIPWQVSSHPYATGKRVFFMNWNSVRREDMALLQFTYQFFYPKNEGISLTERYANVMRNYLPS